MGAGVGAALMLAMVISIAGDVGEVWSKRMSLHAGEPLTHTSDQHSYKELERKVGGG